MPDLDRYRPILWAATALCLLAALVAVPIVGPDDDGDTAGGVEHLTASLGAPASESASTTTAATAADAATTSVPAASSPDRAPTTSASTASTTTTTAPARATAAAATTDDAGAVTASRPGTYRYKVTASDGKVSEATTQVEDKGTANGETKQVVKLRGQGFDSDNDVSWRPDGVYVLVSNLQYGPNHFTCDWDPDAIQLKLPLAVGTTWDSTSSCTFTYGASTVTVVRKTTGKIVERRRVEVAGQAVDAWAIEGTEHVEFAGNAVDGTGTSLFSPKHGLVVRSESHTQQGTTTMEIQNLDPA